MVDRASIFDHAINDIITNKIKFSIVSSGTGSGKTTTFPAKLVKLGTTNNNYRKVIVMLPTKGAVINAYNRAKENKITNVNVDFSVGFARNSEISYNNHKQSLISNSVTGFPMPTEEKEDTNLIYVTTGHMMRLVRECLKYLSVEDYVTPRSLLNFDYIIIDEAHLRTKNMDIDIIIGFLKYMLISFQNKGIPSVIFTSATYSEPGAKIYNIEHDSKFRKDILYVELPGQDYKEKIQNLAGGFYDFIQTLSIKSGIALVFLPGIKEILTVKNGLEREDLLNMLEIAIAHGSRTEGEMQKDVFTPNSENKWKIILSTNIAETSLTIPNVILIVDCGYENIRVVGNNKTIHNKVVRIAKDSAEQRAGRTGRTSNGLVLRMMSPEEYSGLDQTIVPEIQRLPIGNELLLVLDCNVDCRFIFGDKNIGLTRSISDNQANRLNSTLKELAHFRLIRDCNGYFDVTEQGRFVSNLPLSNKSGIIILKAIEIGIDLYPVIILVCIMEDIEMIFNGFKVLPEFYSGVPFYSILSPWLKMCAKYGTINFNEKNINKLTKFCNDNGLDFDGFQTMQKKIINCITKLRLLDYHIDIIMFDPEDLFIKIRGILTSVYFSYKLVTENNQQCYRSTNPNIKHKPLFLSNKFIKIPNRNPEMVTSIFNMEMAGKTQMILWFPHEYSPIGNVVKSLIENVNSEESDDDEFVSGPDSFENDN